MWQIYLSRPCSQRVEQSNWRLSARSARLRFLRVRSSARSVVQILPRWLVHPVVQLFQRIQSSAIVVARCWAQISARIVVLITYHPQRFARNAVAICSNLKPVCQAELKRDASESMSPRAPEVLARTILVIKTSRFPACEDNQLIQTSNRSTICRNSLVMQVLLLRVFIWRHLLITGVMLRARHYPDST
jgi:hypothetical protein